MMRFMMACIVVAGLAACQSQPETAPAVAMAASADESALLRKGDTARALGDYSAAKQHYAQAAALSQGAVRAHLELADIYARDNENAERLAILQQAYHLNPSNLEVSKEYAHALLAAGDAAQAEAVARSGLRQSAEDVRLLNALGVALDQQGKHGAAQEQYRLAWPLAVAAIDREITLNNHALSLVVSGKSAQAIKQLEAELPQVQNKVAIRQMLALAYGIEGDADKAYELGLRDLSVSEVRENLDYYARLRSGEIPLQALLSPQQ